MNMDRAKLKRMTRRTEFYMFLVLIALCITVQIISPACAAACGPVARRDASWLFC